MENLNNLPPFYVGQKVVYITGDNMPKNSIHIVREVILADCGCFILKINTKSPVELKKLMLVIFGIVLIVIKNI